MYRVIAALASCAAVIAAPGLAAAQVFIAAPAAPSQGNPLTAPLDGPRPEFEVASVRPSGDANRTSMNSPPGRFMASGVPLQLVLQLAFRFQPNQTEGIPGWVSSERYDINAKMPDGAPQDQLPYMLQSLLEERFGLEWHTETREVDVYELVIAREDGQAPKLVRSEIDCRPILEARQKALTDARNRGESPEALAQLLERQRLEQADASRCSTSMSMRAQPGGGPPAMTLTARGMELTTLVSLLTGLSGRPVVDRTGLTGSFDFEFTTSPGTALAIGLGGGLSAAPPGPVGVASAGPRAPAGVGAVPVAPDDGPTVFQAVEDLGLKLRSARGPGAFFIVDSIERPDAD